MDAKDVVLRQHDAVWCRGDLSTVTPFVSGLIGTVGRHLGPQLEQLGYDPVNAREQILAGRGASLRPAVRETQIASPFVDPGLLGRLGIYRFLGFLRQSGVAIGQCRLGRAITPGGINRIVTDDGEQVVERQEPHPLSFGQDRLRELWPG
jgi:hypothetical protein